MYGELFDIPQPDELVFISSFAGGEVFPLGCRSIGGPAALFYFSPGDQEYPVYHHSVVGGLSQTASTGLTGTVGRFRTVQVRKHA